MKNQKNNRLNRIILIELICLCVVSVLVVFGIWLSGRGDERAQDTGTQPQAAATASPSVTPRITGEADLSLTITPTPEAGTLTPALSPEASEELTEVPTKQPQGGEEAPDDELTLTPEPTKEAEVIPTVKPKATPTPVPTPTAAPTSTPQPTATPTPTVKPTATPTPEPTKAPEGIYGWVTDTTGEMDIEFIHSLKAPQSSEILKADGAVTTYYYMQTDSRWGSLPYGEGGDTIAKYACGPTSMAIVVSSLTDIKIDPVQMSDWAYDNGYWYPQSGSLHTVVNGTAKAFGLKSEGVGNNADTAAKVKETLRNGGMAVALMGKGHFTKSGHFIVLRGITEDGKILVADCNSKENTMTEWDMELLQEEAKYAADGGPFWIIE